MDRQNPQIIIEWDLTDDPDFSIHKALVNGIYAAHDPLTGFLGSVFKSIWKGVKKVAGAVLPILGGMVAGPVGFCIGAGVGTLVSGGSLGDALMSTGLSAVGLAGEAIVAHYGGVSAMVDHYCKSIGALLPTGLKDALAGVVGSIKDSVYAPLKTLYEEYKPLVKGWADYFSPVVDEITNLLKPIGEAIPEELARNVLADAWGDKRITAEILTSILKAPPQFGLMPDPSLTDYMRDIHKLGKITPPVPPVSMPELNLDHLGPEIHQIWETVTGIPKIIPTLEGVWNSIKDVWATIKDTMIFIANWLKVTLQETLNLLIIAMVDVCRYLPAAINALASKVWESMTEVARVIHAGLVAMGEKIFQGIVYVVNFFRDALRPLWQFVGEIPRFIWESLQYVVSSIHSGINAATTWASDSLSKLWEFVKKEAEWIKYVIVSFFKDYIPYCIQWWWEQIKDVGRWVSETAVSTIVREAKGAWVQVEEHFKNYTQMAYSAAASHLQRFSPMTPEKAPMAGLGLLGIAIAFGMGAHTLSTVTELVHPLKSMGVHYLAGFMSQMGSFGTIASSTMGIIVAYSLRRPMGYYVNSLMRPTQPKVGDLMMMAVKPDISIETFRKGMTYEGYPEEWIDAFQRTMYNEPRHFELGFMGEDQTADAPWLYTKARRAGYCPEDAEVFTRGLIAKIIRTRKEELYRHAFNSYKEGYLTKDQFMAYLDALAMRPEAKYYAVVSADLAYRFDYIGDMVRLFTDTYMADLMDDDDLRVAISSLGIEERKASLIFNKARIRKIPKVMREEKKEAQKAIREMQKKYQDLYRTLYRAGRITTLHYEGYLIALGMTPEMAELIVALEVAREIEKVEDVEAREREAFQKKVEAEQVRKYRELYRRDLISFETLVGYFIMAGVDAELAIAMAETEKVKLIPKPKTTEVITT